MNTWALAFCIGAGGSLGALLRFLCTSIIDPKGKSKFPFGVFIVNCIGCLIVGFFSNCPAWNNFNQDFRKTICIGFCGGFTTFSTFSTQTMKLFLDGNYYYAIANILFNHLAGLLFNYAGQAIAEAI